MRGLVGVPHHPAIRCARRHVFSPTCRLRPPQFVVPRLGTKLGLDRRTASALLSHMRSVSRWRPVSSHPRHPRDTRCVRSRRACPPGRSTAYHPGAHREGPADCNATVFLRSTASRHLSVSSPLTTAASAQLHLLLPEQRQGPPQPAADAIRTKPDVVRHVAVAVHSSASIAPGGHSDACHRAMRLLPTVFALLLLG